MLFYLALFGVIFFSSIWILYRAFFRSPVLFSLNGIKSLKGWFTFSLFLVIFLQVLFIFSLFASNCAFPDHVYIVTGGNAGIGFVTVRKLLSLGATVVMAGRSESHGNSNANTGRWSLSRQPNLHVFLTCLFFCLSFLVFLFQILCVHMFFQ